MIVSENFRKLFEDIEEDAPQIYLEMLRYRSNIRYFSNNRKALNTKYNNQYVAISNERVVGYAFNLEELCNYLRERGINPAGETYIGCFKEKDRPLVLLR